MLNKSSRSLDLLRRAADSLGEGVDPFHSAFLQEHGVTFDECMSMGETMAILIKGYLAAPPEIQNEILIRGTLDGHLRPEAIEYALDARKIGKISERIKEVMTKR